MQSVHGGIEFDGFDCAAERNGTKRACYTVPLCNLMHDCDCFIPWRNQVIDEYSRWAMIATFELCEIIG